MGDQVDTETSLGRPFWTLWTAFSASNLGDGLSFIAMPLLAIGITRDARLIAAVAVFQYLPFLVIGLPAGVIIDRYDRRWIAVSAQVLRVLVLASLVTAIVNDVASLGVLMVASFLIGTSEVMTDGGLPALVRDLVRSDQLEVANSRMIAAQRVTNAFVGPPLGALAFGLESWLPFALAAALSLVGILALTQIPGKFKPQQVDDSGSIVFKITTGLRYVRTHPIIWPLVLTVALFSFAGAATNAVFVVLATERFGLSPVGYGLLVSVDAIASVTMSFFVARFIRRTSHSTSMRFAIVCFVVAALLLGLSTVATVAFVAAIINGLADPSWNIVSGTVRQRLVPDEVFGRMMTAYLFVAWGMKPVGGMVGGFVAEAWGPQWVSIGAAATVGSLFFFARPMFRRVDAAMATPDE